MRRIRFGLLALVALGLAAPAAAQQPMTIAGWGVPAATVTEAAPIPFCLSNKTACFTAFGTVPEFDLNLAGADATPGYAIAIEGPTGPVAGGSPGTPISVLFTASSQTQAVGNVAAGAGDAGAPIKVGGVASTTALPASVGHGQRVNGFFDKSGRQVTTSSPREFRLPSSRIALTATTTETVILPAEASTFLDLVTAQCTNTSATEVQVDWRDASTGAIRFTMNLAPDGGGSNLYWGPDGYPQAAANTAWTIQASASVTSVFCSALARKDL